MMNEVNIQDLYKVFHNTLKKIAAVEEGFYKFKESFLENYEDWEKEYLNYVDYDTEYFIDISCRVRGIMLELSHRVMNDFAMFILLCRTDDELYDKCWLWSPKKWWFYFWKYYTIKYDKEDDSCY